jgi:hypothetical protein
MYAYLDQDPRGRDHSADQPAADPGTANRSGLLGSVTFRQLAGPSRVRLTLWDTPASAAAFLAERAELAAVPGEIYEVVDTGEGPAPAQAPAYARLMYFDGPRAPEQAVAEDLAGRQRIWPAIRGISGLVGTYVLRGPDLGSVVVTLATSVETLDAIARTVMSTELLPGEDPALLPDPDRIEIHHVTGYHLPAAVPAASPEGHLT